MSRVLARLVIGIAPYLGFAAFCLFFWVWNYGFWPSAAIALGVGATPQVISHIWHREWRDLGKMLVSPLIFILSIAVCVSVLVGVAVGLTATYHYKFEIASVLFSIGFIAGLFAGGKILNRLILGLQIGFVVAIIFLSVLVVGHKIGGMLSSYPSSDIDMCDSYRCR